VPGAEVSLRTVKKTSKVSPRAKRTRMLYDRLRQFVGKANELPPDASINHDHYLYGMPKRK
jgi:hypothetical protein